MQAFEFLQTCTALLTLEQIFQLSRFTQIQRTTEPVQNPRTFAASPGRYARVMLGKARFHILGHADIAATSSVLEDVDLIHPGVVAGAGFEPATFRL